MFSVVDAKDGKVVYSKKLDIGKGGGTVYPSIVVAGAKVYVSSDNGTTVVLKPGRAYEELARNQLDGFRSTPVFVGNRMFKSTVRGCWIMISFY